MVVIDIKPRVLQLTAMIFGVALRVMTKHTQQMLEILQLILNTLKDKEFTLNGINPIAFPISMNFGVGPRMEVAQRSEES
jgi:hypothetical protein